MNSFTHLLPNLDVGPSVCPNSEYKMGMAPSVAPSVASSVASSLRWSVVESTCSFE